METEECEFVTLVEAVKAGDHKAFNQLIPMLKPVVGSAIRRLSGGGWTGISKDDVEQEAWIAVYRALFSYDTERYPTPVHSYFRGAIISRLISVIDETYVVRLRRPLKRFIQHARCGVVDWDLNDDELSILYPLVDVRDITRTRHHGASVWNVLYGDDQYVFTQSQHHSGTHEPLDESVANRLDAESLVAALISQLNELERDVFRLRFLEERSRAAVSRTLGWSVVRIAKIEASILAKRVGLEGYYVPDDVHGARL